MRLKPFLFSLFVVAATPAVAQSVPRALEVPATAAWKHAESEMILPPTVDGLTRTELRDNGGDELDIIASYGNEADGVWVTVYLYKTQISDVPLWFDRALTTIMLRAEYGLTGATLPAPAAFARPGAANPSGLRIAIDVAGANVRSTAIAIAPAGGFQLKIRMSASRLDRAALDERLGRFIAGLRWPAETAPAARAAVPILPCPSPLRLRNARLMRVEMADTLMDALSGVALSDGNRTPPVYCREPGPANAAYGIYRADASREAYLIALNDAGIALSLQESIDFGALMGQGSSGRRIAMTLLEREATTVLPSFNRLPPPEQALAASNRGGSTISVSTRPGNRQ